MLTTAEGSALWFQSIHILRYKNANISINIVKSEHVAFLIIYTLFAGHASLFTEI